jgi:uncharacterized metal-binding protein YceD (DUF177 family)
MLGLSKPAVNADQTHPEFSRLIALEDIRTRGIAIEIVADEAERSALAMRFSLRALSLLKATLRLDRPTEGSSSVQVSGSFNAEVTQTCVVALEPVTQTIHETVSALFVPAPADASTDEIEVPIDGDPPEPLPAEGIDIGELVAEHLALAIDPYPRHHDAPQAPLAYETGDVEQETRENPFAALGQLKGKL